VIEARINLCNDTLNRRKLADVRVCITRFDGRREGGRGKNQPKRTNEQALYSVFHECLPHSRQKQTVDPRKLNKVGGYQRRGSEKHSYAEDVPHSSLEFVLRLLQFRVTVAVSHLKKSNFPNSCCRSYPTPTGNSRCG
jgi:hypothetical protein